MDFRKAAFGLCILLLITCPSAAWGQDYVPKGSIFGGVGFGRFYDDEGSLGSGWTVRAGAEWRPFHRFGFEGEYLGIRFHRTDAFKVDGNTHWAFGNVAFYFSRSRIQPYVKGGIGYQRTEYTYSWPGIPVPEFHKSRSNVAANSGAGIRFFVNRHWSINPEIRLVGGGQYIATNYFSISTGYHW